MNAVKRSLVVLLFLVSLAVLIASVAGGVGVWVAKEPVITKITGVHRRIGSALDLAEANLEQVKASLARAGERLDSAREEQRKIAQQPQQGGALRRLLARQVQQRLVPELGNAHEKLHTVAEAAVVVNSILEDVGNIPFLSTSGLDLDSITEMNNSLANVGPTAWELSRLLGEADANSAEADAQLAQIERVLLSMKGMIATNEPRLVEIRQRVDEVKSKSLQWILPATILISALCFWIALSQVSMMFHACSWWKRGGSSNPQ